MRFLRYVPTALIVLIFACGKTTVDERNERLLEANNASLGIAQEPTPGFVLTSAKVEALVFDLTWSLSDDIRKVVSNDGFLVEVREAGSTLYTKQKRIEDRDVRTFRVKNLDYSTKYYFRITALRKNGDKLYSNDIVVATEKDPNIRPTPTPTVALPTPTPRPKYIEANIQKIGEGSVTVISLGEYTSPTRRLYANPRYGYRFKGFSGDCVSTTLTCEVTLLVSRALNVSAEFELATPSTPTVDKVFVNTPNNLAWTYLGFGKMDRAACNTNFLGKWRAPTVDELKTSTSGILAAPQFQSVNFTKVPNGGDGPRWVGVWGYTDPRSDTAVIYDIASATYQNGVYRAYPSDERLMLCVKDATPGLQLQPLTNKYCAGCHAGAGVDARAWWSTRKDTAILRIGNKTMPRASSQQANSMTDADRQLLIDGISELP